MKLSTLLIIGVLGAAAYYFFVISKQPVVPQTSTASNTGGTQLAASQDPWAASVSAISGILNAVGAWAQTAPKTN